MTLVERALHVTTVDLGTPALSLGDIIIWGPDPLYDATNTTDTGATTQGTCVSFNTTDDCLANETIVFPNGSMLEIQGIQLGGTVTSTRTIVGGSGRYRGATGTLTVQPSADRTTWKRRSPSGCCPFDMPDRASSPVGASRPSRHRHRSCVQADDLARGHGLAFYG